MIHTLSFGKEVELEQAFPHHHAWACFNGSAVSNLAGSVHCPQVADLDIALWIRMQPNSLQTLHISMINLIKYTSHYLCCNQMRFDPDRLFHERF